MSVRACGNNDDEVASSERVATLPPPSRAECAPILAATLIPLDVLDRMNARKRARSSVDDISEVLNKVEKSLSGGLSANTLYCTQTHGHTDTRTDGRMMNAGADPGMPTSSVFGT